MTDDARRNSAVLVCVVEDEPFLRMDMVDAIAEAGFPTVDVANAGDAIRLLESRNDIGIVVTDVDMPGSMDGLKLAHAVRRRWPPIQIIVVSGHVNPAVSELPSGGRFFAKPVDSGQLVEAIRRFAAASG